MKRTKKERRTKEEGPGGRGEEDCDQGGGDMNNEKVGRKEVKTRGRRTKDDGILT